MELPLSALARGRSAYISRVACPGDMARRITELGLLPGTRISCELVSPAGDPAAYRVRGALIALRAQDARTVSVTLAEEPL
ncbi:MAG: ferrous iron transport protein A [Oscillospiraceae bacterium]|nr:ferrous iron transport protein A [Oscillospiraceae bacterium]